MIVCKLELWPRGDEEKKRSLGELRIAGIGGDRHVGHYRCELIKSEEYAKREGPWRSGIVLNFRRLMLGPYDLVLRALIACVGGRSFSAVRMVSEEECHFGPPATELHVL